MQCPHGMVSFEEHRRDRECLEQAEEQLPERDEPGRKELKLARESRFAKEQLERYAARYDEIIARGMEQNKNTKGRVAKKEEKALLNRLKKYKENHLLFLYDFETF